MRDHVDLLGHVARIVGHAEVFFLDHQTALQAPVVGSHATRAGIRVATQGLDAAQREHEAARGIHEVGAGAQCPGRLGRGHQLARGDHPHAVAQPGLDQRIDHPGKGFGDRQGHVVGEHLGRRTAAAFAAVDHQEVRCRVQSPSEDGLAQFVDERPAAHGRLHPARPTGQVADHHDLVEQLVDVSDVEMAVRADRVFVRRNAADARDLLGHLHCRQHPALARLGTLRQLDLECSHRVAEFPQPVAVEAAIEAAYAVLGGADLHDHVAAALEVVGRQAALPGVHPAARLFRAHRQRSHRGCRDRPETHAADVDHRPPGQRIAAVALSDEQRRCRQLVGFEHREWCIDEQDGPRLAQVIG